jgi:cleavage and polyadenylation specificity factor subunit 2
LPLLAGKWGLKAKVYATMPIFKMGQMFLYDAFESKRKDEDFDVWNLDDVDAAFNEDRFEQLKYSQHVRLTGRGAGIELTPYCIHSLLSLSLSPAHAPTRCMSVHWACVCDG